MKIPLKSLRESKGITQADLSKFLKISPSTVGMWEQGRREPDYDNLKRLANFFEVTTDYLLGNDGNAICVSNDDEKKLVIGYRALDNSKRQTLFNMLAFLSSPQAADNKIIQSNSGGNNFLNVGGVNSYNRVF